MASQNAFRVSTAKKAIITPYDARIVQVIPHAAQLEHLGMKFLSVPHKHTETKLLNNFGYAVPAPIMSQYDWAGTTPFESQRDTARLMSTNRRAYVLNDMGTGKTRSALYALDFLMREGEVKKALIVAPLSTLTSVWEREIFQCFPYRTAVSLHGTRTKRLKLLDGDFDFFIINHEGVPVIEEELIARSDINAVVIDESALLRNARTKRWKSMNRVVKGKKFAWAMTGSPTPKSPTDAYGQVKLLTPERVPKYFKEFQSMTMYQVTQFKWNARSDANDVVHAAMQPSVRYTREDCIDLPPTTYTTLECTMTCEQKKAYKEMWEECEVQIAEALLAGHKITAPNSGVQFSKLIQIASGFVYSRIDSKTKITAQFDDSGRYRVLTDLIDETTRKLIIFAPFIHLVEHLYAKLLGDGYAVEKIHGGTSKSERDKIFNSFQSSTTPRIIVAHPQTMSHGLTLTAANTVVWYSPVFSLETYEQANARITRPSQTSTTHIVHIQSSGIEKRVYNTLQRRGNMQKELLSLFRVRGQP